MIARARALAAALAVLAVPTAALAAFPQSKPNDPLFDASPLPNATNEQWDLASPAGGFDRGISADRAWPLSTGQGITIADLDLGVQLDHPDLRNRWVTNAGESGARAANHRDDDHNGYVDDHRGWDFYSDDNDPTSDTQNPHGTNVAGVLGAEADNKLGITGVAPGARLLPLRTADNILHQGVRLAEAITYAADNGATVISGSLGADSFGTPLRKAVAYAHRCGVVIAIASGNEFHFHHHYPQVMDEVLAVGGLNPDTANLASKDGKLALVASDFKVKAAYGDYGPHLDVVAPTQVPTTEWGGGDRLNWDGTSAATPHVAAVAALVQSRGKALGLRLSAADVIQIIRMSADDLTASSQGFHAGWDERSGWGRVDAFAAVRMAAAGKVPPVADITSPGWYAPLTGTVTVNAGVHGRSATSWRLELGKGTDPSEWRLVASGRGRATSAPHRIARIAAGALSAGGWTLRLTATDANGNRGEDREYFTAVRDRSLARGYPRALNTSGESSPQIADVDGDKRADIVLATADGIVRVISGRTGRALAGWPRTMLAARHSTPAARRIGTVRSGFLATPAIGDVTGDRRADVVAAGLDGRVYAWDRRGRRLPGFPHAIRLHGTAERGKLDGAIYASPALADLNGDKRLDIVFGAADQRIYAITGRGRDLPGWPVLARDTASGGDVAKILSSPAIGDIDGDHSPDVVEGTAEAYGTTPSTSGRVYAFDARGRLKPGWPVKPTALVADGIPLAGEGVPQSPSLADVNGDGRDEVEIAAFTGNPDLFDGDGSRHSPSSASHFTTAGKGAGSPTAAPAVLALGANGAFGRMTHNGALRFFGGVVDSRLALAQSAPASRIAFDHLLGGWDAASGAWLPAFPRPVEGWQIPTAPAIADVDGDGRAEVIEGSSGNILHAFREDGTEPAGWPKDPGGWIMATPAVGDIDGDGRLEVVCMTRDGYLFVWNTPSRAKPTEWPAFRHDAHNSGRYR